MPNIDFMFCNFFLIILRQREKEDEDETLDIKFLIESKLGDSRTATTHPNANQIECSTDWV